MMKPLQKETADIVTALRMAKEAEEYLHGKTPLTYILGRAISRLCLLDVRLAARLTEGHKVGSIR